MKASFLRFCVYAVSGVWEKKNRAGSNPTRAIYNASAVKTYNASAVKTYNVIAYEIKGAET
jgi:hypothetical protein